MEGGAVYEECACVTEPRAGPRWYRAERPTSSSSSSPAGRAERERLEEKAQSRSVVSVRVQSHYQRIATYEPS